jgi:hypothetical protein
MTVFISGEVSTRLGKTESNQSVEQSVYRYSPKQSAGAGDREPGALLSLYPNFDNACCGSNPRFQSAKDIHTQQAVDRSAEWESMRYHFSSAKFFAQCAETPDRHFRGNNISTPRRDSFVFFARRRADSDGLQNLYREDRISGTRIDE